MKQITIYNQTKGTYLADHAKVADSFISRLVGLLNRKSLALGEGLLIVPCNSIHSCFMRFTFDAIFINENMEVIYIIESMAPFKFSPVIKEAKSVIELPAGVVRQTKTEPGDIISIFPSTR